MRRWSAAVAGATTVVGVAVMAVACAAPVVDAAAAVPAPPPSQVVFVAVPDLRWPDLAAMPWLRALQAHAAVGQLSVRSQGEATRCGDALLQLSSGTRVPSGVVSCDIGAARLASLRQRYRHSRYDVRVGLLGDLLHGDAAATDAAAATVLSTADGPAPVVAPTEAVHSRVVVTVDDGLYGASDRAAAASAVDGRLDVTLSRVPVTSTVVVAGVSDGPRGGPHLHPVIVVGPGWAHRALTSATTGRAPYVQLFDLTATLLTMGGRSVPPAHVSGRPIRTSASRVSSNVTYADADRHAVRALTVGHPTFSAFCGVLFGCLLLILLVPWFVIWPLRLLLAAPLATWLLQLVPWWRWPIAGYVTAIVVVALAGTVAQWLVSRRAPKAALLLMPAIVTGVLVVDQLAGAPLQLSAPFGDNPLVAGRFHGMGNIDFAVTMASLLLCVAVVARTLDRVRGLVFAAVAVALAVVIDGAPMLGDDVGGVLALVPAVAVLLGALAGIRLTVRRVVAVAVAAVLVAVAAGVVDYARPASQQTHAGRFVGQVLHGGAWTELRRKLDSVGASTTTPMVTAVVVVLVVGLIVARVAGRSFPDPVPGVRVAAASAGVLAVVGSLVNDSGMFVAAAAAVAFVPAAAVAVLGDTRRL